MKLDYAQQYDYGLSDGQSKLSAVGKLLPKIKFHFKNALEISVFHYK